VTVTHKTTITCINQLGCDFDQAVKNWKDTFLPSLHLDLAEIQVLHSVRILCNLQSI